ncbi:tyrosine--tRNA ligase [Halapricum desulfuricans]|uniref:Tyrosine--tRNA ligase n=1 Tax=Halapricum desulfuricans TaxID=2841257 RepID=A0A897NJH2_9EURY|nr:tyrosine--tRNA ligase [Halapricum desulfuricans]QSG09883.1 Tyrosyl-tRNA synthetase [Halapricum desulfuricans]QSG11029.1 Tyrosyl-tRNA synthetase [Halapricum desulfuricans]
MNVDERLELATRHTQEVVTEEELRTLLDERDEPRAYIGYAPTGEMHIGHFTTMRKLADFLDAGLDVTVLIADLHAHLDDEKSPFDLLEARAAYYEETIRAMIDAAGADPEGVAFVRGREFELDEEYSLELLRMAAETTISRAQRAASEVVRESDSPKLGGLLYPLMQTLDVDALDADIAYGGVDQRGIYMLSREILPDHGGDAPICLFAPLLSGLSGGKMSASEEASKVNLNDSPEAVAEKLNDAYCPMGEREDNGVLEYVQHLVFPILDEHDESFVVERPEKYGGDLVYDSYEQLESDFLEEELHPQDLKNAAGEYISDVIDPIRTRLNDNPQLLADAYPEKYGDETSA